LQIIRQKGVPTWKTGYNVLKEFNLIYSVLLDSLECLSMADNFVGGECLRHTTKKFLEILTLILKQLAQVKILCCFTNKAQPSKICQLC
jgi:hypothetical protein